MKKLVLSLAFVLMGSFAIGQELTKEQIKEQKKQRKALMTMVQDTEAKIQQDPVAAANALKTATSNELVNTDAYVWFVSTSAKKAVIDNENRKRAEGAAFDEPLMYSYVYELGTDLANCEKYDNMPDAKGRIKPKYSDFIKMTYAQQFAQFYNAGAYYYGNEEYEKAYNLFKMFIDSSDKLYKEGMMPKDTVNVPVAAYNMSLCGMQLENYDMVLTHVDLAMQNPQMAESAYRFKAAAYLEKGDSATWLNMCKEGITKFPSDLYYSQSLIHYYDSRNQSEELGKLADDLIATDPSNPLFVYLKGYIAHQKEDFDTAIEWYEKTLNVDPNYENALSNLGRCYLIKAQEYSTAQSSTKVTDKKKIAEDKKILDGYYNKALPLLEKLREVAPDKHDLWLMNLTNCYYNLKMTDKLEELEKLQKSLGY
ncbi:MAG: tetratricopeptide repeat protein [Bacteroidaceae bacterium]|nr:tetratricopeptide repeat protein [Bacteroidaceae bacterium]